MAFCLIKDEAQKLISALKKGDFNPEILKTMKTTREAEAYLSKFISEDNARQVNLLYEKKQLSSNFEAGEINFYKEILGDKDFLKHKEELSKRAQQRAAERLQRLYDPKTGERRLDAVLEEKAMKKYGKRTNLTNEQIAELASEIDSEEVVNQIVSDAFNRKYGANLTPDEAQTLVNLTAKAQELKAKYDPVTGKFPDVKDKMAYGAQEVLARKYLDELKGENISVKEAIQNRFAKFSTEFKTNKIRSVSTLGLDALKTITDNSIAMVATLDNSFLGRQGLKTLLTEPQRFIQAKFRGVKYQNIWWNMAKQSFIDFAKTIGGKEASDAMWADVYSSKNYINGAYKEAGILPKIEEQFPTQLPAKVPGIGRIFKASEEAFSNSAVRARTKLYDFMAELADKNGVDVADKYQRQSMGKVISSLTARGQWGKYGESPIVKLVLWAPKMLKSNIDVLTAHAGQDISPFARKQAALNLISVATTTAAIMAISNAIKPGSAELDPRSADFGKIKVGNTRFDFTGGAGSLVVLGARLLTYTTNMAGLTDVANTKSTTTGQLSKYGSGYGQRTAFDAIIDFLTNKTTPGGRILVDFWKGKNFKGQKPTLANEAYSAFTPISLQNLIELKDDPSADRLIGFFTDIFGISANTYDVSEVSWEDSTGKELMQFKEKIGNDKFKEANEKYNQRVSDKINEVRGRDSFNALSSDEKAKALTKIKNDIKQEIFDEYKFKYKETTTKKESKASKNRINEAIK